MPDFGPVDWERSTSSAAPPKGTDRADVSHGTKDGEFGVIEVGNRAGALATEPVVVFPALGFERAAWAAFHRVVSGVSVSGLRPSHLTVDFNLPPEMSDETFETIWRTFDREARKLGVGIATGHTARYAGCAVPMVGVGTAVAVGAPTDVIRQDGAQVGDRVIVTKGPAIEATGLLANQFRSMLANDLSREQLAAASDRHSEMSTVDDALTVAAAGGVTAMRIAGPRGVYGGLFELARAGSVQISIDSGTVPIQPGVGPVCEAVGIDPWISSSRGTLLATVSPDSLDGVLSALSSADIPAAAVGTVQNATGDQRLLVDDEPVANPETDPFWSVVGTAWPSEKWAEN